MHIERILRGCSVECRKNSATLRPDADGCRSVGKCAEGGAQSHFIKINVKVCIFLQNLSNLEAYDRVWTRGSLHTDRVNRYTICTVPTMLKPLTVYLQCSEFASSTIVSAPALQMKE